MCYIDSVNTSTSFDIYRVATIMPKILLTAIDGKIPVRDQYTAGEIAYIMGVAHRTACKLIDDGSITGFRLPPCPNGKLRERRVHHGALLAFVMKYPSYKYMLDKLTGLKEHDEFSEPQVIEVSKCKTKKAKAK